MQHKPGTRVTVTPRRLRSLVLSEDGYLLCASGKVNDSGVPLNDSKALCPGVPHELGLACSVAKRQNEMPVHMGTQQN